jgi:ferredoxin-NADP reductase
MVLLLCAGIGVTPIQSIGKSILYEHHHQNRPLKYMNMVWVVRDLNIVHDLPPLGADCMDKCSSDGNNVQIDVYCTRTKNISINAEELNGTINEQRIRDPESSTTYYNVRHGQRPDIDAIFQQTKQRANEMGEYNIVVFACGPTTFMTDIQVACRTYSQSSMACHNNNSNNQASGVYFDLHTEHFEF